MGNKFVQNIQKNLVKFVKFVNTYSILFVILIIVKTPNTLYIFIIPIIK